MPDAPAMNATPSDDRMTPQLRTLKPLGHLAALRDDPLGFMTRVCQEHGDVVRFRLGPYRTFLFRHPDAVKHVLVDNNHNYDKQTKGWDMMRLLLGRGLLTSEGDFWRRQRRIAQPAFHRRRIAELGQSMVEATLDLAREWEHHAGLGRTVDVAHEMSTLTLRIVCRTLLSTGLADRQAEVSVPERVYAAVTEVNEYAAMMSRGGLLLPLLFPSLQSKAVTGAVKTLDEIVYGIIEERRRSGDDRKDLLSMLMQATDAETGEAMSDEQLRDEVLTIFLAGHETTANALAWTLLQLSRHPRVERRLRAELDEVLQGRPPRVDDLPSLPYLTQVIRESMRLHPPAWMLDRRCVEDDVVQGHRVPANSLIVVSQWVTHRDERWWPNPEGFDPDRFANERERPRYAYFPFGGGPRQCIGNNFALMESALVLATLLPRFRPWLVSGHVVEPEALVTLRPKGGLPMELERVSSTTERADPAGG